jgi:hypothetical protein
VEWKVKETIVPVESRTNCDFGKNWWYEFDSHARECRRRKDDSGWIKLAWWNRRADVLHELVHDWPAKYVIWLAAKWAFEFFCGWCFGFMSRIAFWAGSKSHSTDKSKASDSLCSSSEQITHEFKSENTQRSSEYVDNIIYSRLWHFLKPNAKEGQFRTLATKQILQKYHVATKLHNFDIMSMERHRPRLPEDDCDLDLLNVLGDRIQHASSHANFSRQSHLVDPTKLSRLTDWPDTPILAHGD